MSARIRSNFIKVDPFESSSLALLSIKALNMRSAGYLSLLHFGSHFTQQLHDSFYYLIPRLLLSQPKLFRPIKVGDITLQQRLALAPLTRTRNDVDRHTQAPIVDLVRSYQTACKHTWYASHHRSDLRRTES
ncbi:hypothetical protein BDN72DRAFT_848342 [Pluteus cervinus]|uniref:Uncharacterized protein n=1 Tax=Pluteus cervinus TaxID=181527 RepID=A0ACD3AAK9_9AGAR|nr:hypothetical protein BDN72DRAFT_848342 [Pluteus cervinus]